MSVNKKPRRSGRGRYSEVLINFLNLSYEKSKDISILKKYVAGPYPVVVCALAKAKLKQVELQRRGAA